MSVHQAVSLQVDEEELVGRAHRHPVPSTPHRVMIASGKGGVGKTQIAANLGVLRAERGDRVLLIDADFGLAGLDLVLGVRPSRTLLDVVREGVKPEDVVVRAPSGVALFPAAQGRYDMANLDSASRARLRAAIDRVASEYDLVFIDAGAGIGAGMVELASQCHEALIVVTEDPTSIRDAYATIKVLLQRTGLTEVRLLVNQVASLQEAHRVHDQVRSLVRRFLSVDVARAFTVPRDLEVRSSLAVGRPLVLRAPLCPASRALGRIADSFPSSPRMEKSC